MSTQKLKSPPAIDSPDENRIRKSISPVTILILVSVFTVLVSSFILLQYKNRGIFRNLEIDVEVITHNGGSSKELKLTVDPRHKIRGDIQMEILSAVFLEDNGISPLRTNKHLDTYYQQASRYVTSPRTSQSVFFEPDDSEKYILIKFTRPPTQLVILLHEINFIAHKIFKRNQPLPKLEKDIFIYKISLDSQSNFIDSEYIELKNPDKFISEETTRILRRLNFL